MGSSASSTSQPAARAYETPAFRRADGALSGDQQWQRCSNAESVYMTGLIPVTSYAAPLGAPSYCAPAPLHAPASVPQQQGGSHPARVPSLRQIPPIPAPRVGAVARSVDTHPGTANMSLKVEYPRLDADIKRGQPLVEYASVTAAGGKAFENPHYDQEDSVYFDLSTLTSGNKLRNEPTAGSSQSSASMRCLRGSSDAFEEASHLSAANSDTVYSDVAESGDHVYMDLPAQNSVPAAITRISEPSRLKEEELLLSPMDRLMTAVTRAESRRTLSRQQPSAVTPTAPPPNVYELDDNEESDAGERFLRDMEVKQGLYEDLHASIIAYLCKGKAGKDGTEHEVDAESSIAWVQQALKELYYLHADVHGRTMEETSITSLPEKGQKEYSFWEALEELILKHHKELNDADAECAHSLFGNRGQCERERVVSIVEEHIKLQEFLRTRQRGQRNAELDRVRQTLAMLASFSFSSLPQLSTVTPNTPQTATGVTKPADNPTVSHKPHSTGVLDASKLTAMPAHNMSYGISLMSVEKLSLSMSQLVPDKPVKEKVKAESANNPSYFTVTSPQRDSLCSTEQLADSPSCSTVLYHSDSRYDDVQLVSYDNVYEPEMAVYAELDAAPSENKQLPAAVAETAYEQCNPAPEKVKVIALPSDEHIGLAPPSLSSDANIIKPRPKTRKGKKQQPQPASLPGNSDDSLLNLYREAFAKQTADLSTKDGHKPAKAVTESFNAVLLSAAAKPLFPNTTLSAGAAVAAKKGDACISLSWLRRTTVQDDDVSPAPIQTVSGLTSAVTSREIPGHSRMSSTSSLVDTTTYTCPLNSRSPSYSEETEEQNLYEGVEGTYQEIESVTEPSNSKPWHELACALKDENPELFSELNKQRLRQNLTDAQFSDLLRKHLSATDRVRQKRAMEKLQAEARLRGQQDAEALQNSQEQEAQQIHNDDEVPIDRMKFAESLLTKNQASNKLILEQRQMEKEKARAQLEQLRESKELPSKRKV